METPRLYGPLPLTAERIENHLQASSPGVYALGDARDDLLVIRQVGRSDYDLRSALAAQVGRFTHFKFRYALSAPDAFGTECELYHAVVTLENPNHPIAPDGTNLKCRLCHDLVPAGQPHSSAQRESGNQERNEAGGCADGKQLLETYYAARGEFYHAKLPSAKAMRSFDPNLSSRLRAEREAFARLTAARKRYWSHVMEHGCRPAADISAGRLELERRLRRAMREAWREFIATNEQFDHLIGVALESEGTADGVLGREQAKRLRDAAFQRYDEALRNYSDLVIGGREPDQA